MTGIPDSSKVPGEGSVTTVMLESAVSSGSEYAPGKPESGKVSVVSSVPLTEIAEREGASLTGSTASTEVELVERVPSETVVVRARLPLAFAGAW